MRVGSRRMKEVEVAVMLADISGSTALYESVGNAEALKQVSTCLDLLRSSIEKHGGDFVSSKGDDVLCIFDEPKAALDVGIEVFEAMKQHTLSLHAGVDFGPVIRTHDDVFGDSVNMAARLATFAKSGEILCSQKHYDRLSGHHRAMLRFFGPSHFKGKTAISNIYLFSDAPPGQGTVISFAPKPEGPATELPDNDPNAMTVALRIGYETFVCTPDTSTIGTYVCFGGQVPTHVRRETLLLPASCTISLARTPGEEGAQEITCDLLRSASE